MSPARNFVAGVEGVYPSPEQLTHANRLLFGMDYTPELHRATTSYLSDVFGRVEGPDGDPQLATLMRRAVAAGIPDIAVSSDVGRFLAVLTRLATNTRDSRGQVLELGTLAGYSGIWIARALPYGGRLYTVE